MTVRTLNEAIRGKTVQAEILQHTVVAMTDVEPGDVVAISHEEFLLLKAHGKAKLHAPTAPDAEEEEKD